MAKKKVAEKDQDINKEVDEEEVEDAPSAGTKKTVERDDLVPIGRFNEKNEEAKKLRVENDQLKAEKKAAIDKQLIEQEEWKELSDRRGEELVQANAKAEKVDDMAEAIEQTLAAQMEQIPEELHSMIPDELSALQKLQHIARNKEKFSKSKPYSIGAGKRGSEGNKDVVLSPEQKKMAKNLGVKEEDYAKQVNKE